MNESSTPTWQQLPDCGDRIGWPWKPASVEDTDFQRLSAGDDYEKLARPVLVVTPSYNQGPFLEQTIRSVLLQGHPKLVYRVIDGGSTDESAAIIQRYRPWLDRGVVEPDDGQSDAICKGIEGYESGWFHWINSDDWMLPRTLSQLSVPQWQDCDLLAMNIQVVGDGSPYLIKNRNLSAKQFLLDGDYSFAQPGLWFDIERLRRCGGIDRQLQYGFDWDLLIRYLATDPKIEYLDRVAVTFRFHEESKTCVENQKDSSENLFEIERARIYDKLEATLSPDLVAACRLGRRRRVWNEHLTHQLDARGISPIRTSLGLIREMIMDPRARLTRRGLMAIARIMSRYARSENSLGIRQS